MTDYDDGIRKDKLPTEPDLPFFEFVDDDIIAEDDPNKVIYEQVLTELGIERIDSVIIQVGEAAPENIRGNRYTTIVDALIDLHLSGILTFSRVVIDDDEIEIEVDADS